MAKWEGTPFASMAIAAEFARKFIGVEPEPVDKQGFAAFVVEAKGERTLVAQVVGPDGQPVGPVRQLTLRKAHHTPDRRKRVTRDGAGGPPQFGLRRVHPTSALCQPTMLDRIAALEFKVSRLTKLLQSRQVAPAHDTSRGQEPPDVGGAQPPRQVGAGGGCASITGGGDIDG